MGELQYQWVNCNNNFQPIVGATQASFTPTSSGSYAVVISSNGCTDTSICYSINNVGFEQLEVGSDFTIFPNPSNGNFQISSKHQFKKSSLRIINTIGELVCEKGFEGNELIDFKLNLSAGVYFVEMIGDHTNKTVRRILIQ